MRVVVDMNLSPRWCAALEDAGIAADHWSTLAPVEAFDEDIMEFAGANGAVVLTNDLDFGEILPATRGTKPSVIQLRSAKTNPELNAAAVIEAIQTYRSVLEEGALVTVDPMRVRLTLLPLAC